MNISYQDAKDLSAITRDECMNVVIRLQEERDALVKALKAAQQYIGDQPLEVSVEGRKNTLVTEVRPVVRLLSEIDSALRGVKGVQP